MAYVDQNQSGSKTVSAVISAIVLAAVGYAFVNGLAYDALKRAATKLNVIDIQTPPPPPPKKPPPPPKDVPKVESPPIVTPPPLVTPPAVQTPQIVQVAKAPPYIPPPAAPVVQAPPPPKPSMASGPKVRGDPSFGISDEDYPPNAVRNNEQGVTSVSFTVNTQGRAEGCQVTGSSGFSDLDQLTCTLVMRRARYTPAKDVGGNAMASTDRRSIRWTIPKD